MAYDEDLAHQIREHLEGEENVTERAMFGGLAFLLGGNMTVSASRRGGMMVRVGPDAAADALGRPHTEQIIMRGRPMIGWIYVEAEGVRTSRQVGAWVRRAAKFTRTLPAKA